MFPCSHAAPAQGVGASADLTGTVTDPSGREVPNAKVTATDAAKGLQRTVMTDGQGSNRLSGLAPASYKVTVEHTGFQMQVVTDVVLTVGQTMVLDFQLKLSGMSTHVEVNAEPPIVDTERGSQANTLTQNYIAQLPIDRRDYLTFTLLAPGVSDSTRLASDQDFRVKQMPQSGLSFYGSNGRGNSVTVDGGEANDDSGGVRLTVSQDAVQEFQVNRSNYSAELGGASGASINIVLKSGAHEVYGSAYKFFRNDAMDATDPFAFSQALQPGAAFNPANADSQGQPAKNSLSRQQYGGTVGFPIKKDKTFLFVAFEGLRQDAENAVPLLTHTNIFRPDDGVKNPLNNQQAIINGLAAQGSNSVQCLNPPQPKIPAATCAAILTNGLTVSSVTGLSAGQIARNGFLINQFETNGGLFHYNTREYFASGRFDLSSLKRITLGGAAASPTLIREVEEKLGCTCFSGYGLTETAPVLSISAMKPGLNWEEDQRFVQSMTGYAIPGVELRVVDQNDQDVPRDGQSMGEIIARSDGVMKGYWQQPEATADVLRGGWFHTGDMATWNEDGYILIVDRKKDIIVSGGENISSLEVEKILLSHPAVLEVAVLPVPDHMWGEVPKALVVLKPGTHAGEIELIEHCRSRLAHYKCPRSVEIYRQPAANWHRKSPEKRLAPYGPFVEVTTRKKYWQGSETIRPELPTRGTNDAVPKPESSSGGNAAKRAAQNE